MNTKILESHGRAARGLPILLLHEKTATLVSTFDADKHLTAEKLDGCYLLKTDRKDLSADEIWRVYTLLTRAEDAFRDMKSPLVIRPIFHHKERRTDSHIFLCLLAYHLLTAKASADERGLGRHRPTAVEGITVPHTPLKISPTPGIALALSPRAGRVRRRGPGRRAT
jgi:hypothetical protein